VIASPLNAQLEKTVAKSLVLESEAKVHGSMMLAGRGTRTHSGVGTGSWLAPLGRPTLMGPIGNMVIWNGMLVAAVKGRPC
jgi:hypothetical protein